MGAGRLHEPGGVLIRRRAERAPCPGRSADSEQGPLSAAFPSPPLGLPPPDPTYRSRGFRSPGPAAPSGPHQRRRQRAPEAWSGPPPSAAAASETADRLPKPNSEGASGKRFYRLSPMTLNPPAVLPSDWLMPLQREEKTPNPRRRSCTEAFIGDLGKCTEC